MWQSVANYSIVCSVCSFNYLLKTSVPLPAVSLRFTRLWRSAGTTTPACVHLLRSLLCALTCSGTVRSFKITQSALLILSRDALNIAALYMAKGQTAKTRSFFCWVPAWCSSLWLEVLWFELRTGSRTTAKVPLSKALDSPFSIVEQLNGQKMEAWMCQTVAEKEQICQVKHCGWSFHWRVCRDWVDYYQA